MPLPEQQDLVNNAGSWTAGIIAVLGAFRFAWLRLSKDKVTLAGDAADLDALKRLQERVEKMDAKIDELEVCKQRMFGFTARCMAYIAGCDCVTAKDNRETLQAEYEKLIASISPKVND